MGVCLIIQSLNGNLKIDRRKLFLFIVKVDARSMTCFMESGLPKQILCINGVGWISLIGPLHDDFTRRLKRCGQGC